MLRFSEEILLLILDDESGEFVHVPEWSLRCALAGAALMDLAFENRIDSDPNQLVLIDSTPVGDMLLDPILTDISESSEEVFDARHWVERAATEHAYAIRDRSLDRLIERGILYRRDDRFMWVFRSRRYPTVDGEAEREVKMRIMGVLLSDEIPHPRDVVIICLADACGLLKEILSRRELGYAAERIEQVRKLDLIGQAVSQVVWDIEASLALAMHPML